MAIVKMKKFNLFAFESQKETLLEELQRFQGVQFTNLALTEMKKLDFVASGSEDMKLSILEEKQAKVRFSIEILSAYGEKISAIDALKRGKKQLNVETLKNLADKYDWETVYKRLKAFDDQLNSKRNEVNKLKSEIDNLEPWVNFDASTGDLKNLKKCTAALGTISKKAFEEFKTRFNEVVSCGYLESLGEVKEGFNVLVIVHEDEANSVDELARSHGFSKVNLQCEGVPAEIINDLNYDISKLVDDEKMLENSIASMHDELENLQVTYDRLEYELNKVRACTNFIRTDKVLALEGWVPETRVDELQAIIDRVAGEHHCLEMRDPEEDDEVPVLLENNKWAEPYEIITAMYSLPNYREVDPTPIMAPFFFIFFGMMLSDFGYGFVMFVASVLALKLLPLEKEAKKFSKLFLSISISTMIWGILYGSYFGDAPKLFSSVGIKPVWLDPSLSPMTVLVVAAAMGVIHLFTGLGIKTYELIKDGKPWDALFDVGFWYLLITGIILLVGGPAAGLAFLGPVGKWLAIAGAAGIVLTGGRANKNVFAKLIGGLGSLYNITGYLGDVLSYSRLLALGLATGLIGSSFNLMIKLLGNGVVAWVFGIMIFLGGHIFNLLINALGAYVHACRLQYLEFFGKFYNGGGKAFAPFKSKNKYINIIED